MLYVNMTLKEAPVVPDVAGWLPAGLARGLNQPLLGDGVVG
jgi:hypothetical protein